MRQLWTFLGMSDRRATTSALNVSDDVGPLARALLQNTHRFDEMHVVDDRPDSGEMECYLKWLSASSEGRQHPLPAIFVHRTWPAGREVGNFPPALRAAQAALETVALPPGGERVYSLSSGTTSMTLALILLAHSWRYAGRCLLVDRTQGIEWIEVPRELLQGTVVATESILNRELPVPLDAIHAEVDVHYLERALEQGGNPDAAAALVGFAPGNALMERYRQAFAKARGAS